MRAANHKPTWGCKSLSDSCRQPPVDLLLHLAFWKTAASDSASVCGRTAAVGERRGLGGARNTSSGVPEEEKVSKFQFRKNDSGWRTNKED